MPDFAGRGDLWFCVELYGESKHHAFPIVYQVPFDDQLALFSLSGFDLMSLDVVMEPKKEHTEHEENGYRETRETYDDPETNRRVEEVKIECIKDDSCQEK